MNRIAFAAALLAATAAAPLGAKTHRVAPGEGAGERLQEALILAAPGDTIELGEGRFTLTDGLSLDVDGVTVRGAGIDQTVLDFSGQQGSGEGLLVTSDNVTLRDFAVENPKGDGIKSKGADNIVYYRIFVSWTAGPLATNGAYGIYPVESTGVLINNCMVRGASDAGIYVGQSRRVTVKRSIVEYNVAGIEIENSRDVVVTRNISAHNTGGILVFDLPGLPITGGGNVLVLENQVIDNDTPNFAPPGNIVAGVRRGTGVMVMANDDVRIIRNQIEGNATAAVMVIAYPNGFDDPQYNPFPRRVDISDNAITRNGYDPQIDGAPSLLAAFGGVLPPVLWDGLGEAPTAIGVEDSRAWSLGLPAQGASVDQSQPAPVMLLPAPLLANPPANRALPGAPAELEARLQ